MKAAKSGFRRDRPWRGPDAEGDGAALHAQLRETDERLAEDLCAGARGAVA